MVETILLYRIVITILVIGTTYTNCLIFYLIIWLITFSLDLYGD